MIARSATQLSLAMRNSKSRPRDTVGPQELALQTGPSMTPHQSRSSCRSYAASLGDGRSFVTALTDEQIAAGPHLHAVFDR